MNSQTNHFAFALILIIVLIGLLADGVLGHSYVTSPTSRGNQKQTTTGCRGPDCLGPCDKPASQARAPITVQRGQSLTIQWPRNNHAGGFIRIAWALTTDSDSASAFDSNVQEIFCHERGGCKPDDPSNPNGGDSAPADGSFQPCQLSITVPPHLTDGKWTLQWAWFGGAFALGDYYSCVDYQVSGGPTGAKPTAIFSGGDYTYPNQQKCKFFNTDRLHQCVNEPCNNPVYPLQKEESGPAFGLSGSTPSPSPSPSPSPAPSPTPITTHKATSTSTSTSTTGPRPSTSTSTSGSRSTSTSTTTTGSRSTSTSTSSSSSSGSNSAMCYLPGTPNLNGKTNGNPGSCGRKAPRARCGDNQCCSQWGYCGPVPRSDGTYYESVDGKMKVVSEAFAFQLYCNKTQGDYRKVPCNTIQGGIQSNEVVGENKQTGGSNSLVDINYLRSLMVVGVSLSFLLGYLF